MSRPVLAVHKLSSCVRCGVHAFGGFIVACHWAAAPTDCYVIKRVIDSRCPTLQLNLRLYADASMPAVDVAAAADMVVIKVVVYR